MGDQESILNWNFMYWIVTIFGIPLTIPWLVFHIMNCLRFKKRKAALHGKVVVMITGASSGLGESLAHAFYHCGCRLVLVARRKQELQRVKDALSSLKIKVPTYTPIILPMDLTEIDLIPVEVSKILKTHSKIDVLINNAGVSFRGESVETKVDIDMKLMLINYFGQIALTKAVMPSMLKQNSGHVVCISSIQGKIAIPYRSAYAASKHALEAWCDSTRAELSNTNIRITVVSPGYIKTSLSLNALTGNGQKYGVMDETTLSGYSPKKVADRILQAVLQGDKEIVIGTFTQKCAIIIRTLFPNHYFKIMEKRAKKFRKVD